MNRTNKGFTLVEVMLVAGIISLLAAIALPNLLRARIHSNESLAQSTLKTIATALENYFAVNSEYPADMDDLTSITPPYLNVDYFSTTYKGYEYTADTLEIDNYLITAVPQSSADGVNSFSIATGGVLSTN